MTTEEKAYVKKWFEVADHDIENARMIIESNPVILDIACFHCQQAVEKYLKAFLVYKKTDDHIMPSLKQTKDYYKIALEVKKLVLKKIRL
jgi:HEPN domain-containing protein